MDTLMMWIKAVLIRRGRPWQRKHRQPIQTIAAPRGIVQAGQEGIE
jgi:hypothetical protein